MMMGVGVMMVMVLKRIRSRSWGVTCSQRGMYLLTATPLDQVDRMCNNTIGEQHLHVLPHSLDTPRERHHEGVRDRPCDRPGQGCERRVLQRRGKQEMHDPRGMPLDQRCYRLSAKPPCHFSAIHDGT